MNRSALQSSYSWSRFGREAEFVIILYLKNLGWDIWLSKGSRGPADIIATQKSRKWLIQVKSSMKIPRLKGYEVKRLRETALITDGLAVIATLKPAEVMMDTKTAGEITVGNYVITFYSLLNWKRITP
jgi:Holliday junction resolvase